jgi:hypothetical protein
LTSRVIIFHDETGDSGIHNSKGHVLLFVPVNHVITASTPMFGEERFEYSPFDKFLGKLTEIRATYKLIDQKLHFTDIAGTKWTWFDLGKRLVVEAIVDALRHKRADLFDCPLCFKVAVMIYPKKSDLSLYGGADRQEKGLRHKETILRIMLKGAAHYLYGDQHNVIIEQIVSDGLPDHRELSESRIIGQLYYEDLADRKPLRDYISFAPQAAITHVLSDHKEYQAEIKKAKLSHFLQIADYSLGAGLRALDPACDVWKTPPQLQAQVAHKKNIIAYPFRDMLMKSRRGKAFQRSGHYRSFAFSEVSFASGKISFRSLQPESHEYDDSQFDFLPV